MGVAVFSPKLGVELADSLKFTTDLFLFELFIPRHVPLNTVFRLIVVEHLWICAIWTEVIYVIAISGDSNYTE